MAGLLVGMLIFSSLNFPAWNPLKHELPQRADEQAISDPTRQEGSELHSCVLCVTPHTMTYSKPQDTSQRQAFTMP